MLTLAGLALGLPLGLVISNVMYLPIQGSIIVNISGIISCCASRMSLTAAPAAIISEPIVKNAMR